jgi:tetratricopeptide (TPR) repeat protein/predicted Ser/Thr protein kinase
MSQEIPDRSNATFAGRLHDRHAAQQQSTVMLHPAVPPRALPRGTAIGRYRLLELLGEGGMGAVYLAEQHEPVHRKVALKLMRATLPGPSAVARFNAERQALARLSHPSIAAMYDAGTTDDGYPFFVMEHVEGRPLVEYCDEHRLTIRQRVELFIQICKGVQHAHQKGVIHRDLKPSNVLVAEIEGRAVPKIIDFGIAKAIDQPFGDATAVLTSQGIIGTPGYMSPEALSGDDLDTRTDIYSLGVILYELLAGVKPHKVDDLPLAVVIRTVAENDTVLPRTLFRALGAEKRVAIAALRREEDRSLAAALGGDLGWIARKATAREREERYGAAADLESDLQRHLNDEPVVASPPSLRYRAVKFARRHRAGVVAAGLVLVAIVGGIAGTTIGMLRAQRARSEAEAVSKFLTDLLDSASPWNRTRETTVRQLLAEAAQKIGHDLKDQPAARAELLETIGSSEFHLGHLDRAEQLLREALRLRIELEGRSSGRVGAILNDLGLVRKHQDHFDDAEAMLRESLVIREKAYGHRHSTVARGLFDLASILALRGKNAEAEAAFRESLALRETFETPMTIALTMNGLGQHLARTGRPAEAETLIRRSLEMRKRNGDRGYAYAMSLLDLGKTLAQLNRLDEAEAADQEGVKALASFVDPNDPADHRLDEAKSQLATAQKLRSAGVPPAPDGRPARP